MALSSRLTPDVREGTSSTRFLAAHRICMLIHRGNRRRLLERHCSIVELGASRFSPDCALGLFYDSPADGHLLSHLSRIPTNKLLPERALAAVDAVGLFARRAKDDLHRIGATQCRLESTDASRSGPQG